MCTLRPMRCFAGLHGFVYILCHASRLSKTPHFWELHTPAGAMTPKFELGRDFLYNTPTPSFIILCLLLWKLSCWQTRTHTNPQTNRRCRKHPVCFAMLRSWVITEPLKLDSDAVVTWQWWELLYVFLFLSHDLQCCCASAHNGSSASPQPASTTLDHTYCNHTHTHTTTTYNDTSFQLTNWLSFI